jgi:hypothetical protein
MTNDCLDSSSRYLVGAWNQRLQELKDFYKEHGHVSVPHVYPNNPYLSQWVKRQRYQYRLKQMGKHSTLSDERERVLNSIGFVWDSHQTSWNESLRALQRFVREHGHTRVSKSIHPSLNTWCKHQRREYKRFVSGMDCHLTVDRIRQLEAVGFDFDPRNMLKLKRKNDDDDERSRDSSTLL